MNKKVYLLAFLLVVMAGSISYWKLEHGSASIDMRKNPHLWRVRVVINMHGVGTRGKSRLTLPKSNTRQTIYNEHVETDGLEFYEKETAATGNRRGYWKSDVLEGIKTAQYIFSAETYATRYVLPMGIKRPEKPLEYYPAQLHPWLEPSDFIQSDDKNIVKKLKKIIKNDKTVDGTIRQIYDFVRGQIVYRSEKGSKDALKTLNALEADCGGKARLFAAFSRAAGIPSRVVGGLILKSGTKEITHAWVENYVNGHWIPFDVVNGHYAFIPDYYLELHRGDISLIHHLGLKKIEYFFVIGKETVPPLDNPWSLYALPTHFQSMIKVLLLIPVGALIVTIFRTIIGVPTLGTFTPILLTLALRQVSWKIGVGCLLGVILIGWIFRKMLDGLKILVIPRLGILLTMVVIIVLGIMIVGYHMGNQKVLFMSLFPMVIMTWMVERFSILEIEDGPVTAIKTFLGNVIVSAATYVVFERHDVSEYMFAFPEILLVIMAILLLMGRYTGIRISEIFRFMELLKYQKKKNKA